MTYELTGKIKDISTNRITNETTLTLSINEMRNLTQCYDELHNVEKLLIVIDKYREKRSLNANALCWKMCNEIANILRTNKESVYVDMLKSYGQSEVISVISSIDVSGYFKYYDEFGKGYVNNKEFTHYRVYKGSSEYDTQEMAILLDGIISEAKELGICVMSEQELSLIKSEWNK